ncbi:MAG: dienelactone hydrolase family protein [Burkholderiales bacterium]
MKIVSHALALAVALAAASASAEHLAGSERVEFAPQGGGEKISGFLFSASGVASGVQSPGVVLVHGSGGVRNAREGFWGREISSAGVTVVAIDSFTARGISSTVEDQSRITTAQMIRDAFGALAYLATLPGVDATRVAIMGMSRGGSVALQSADDRAVDGSARFAAHIPLYPGCTLQYRVPRMRGPILMLIGANDDYTGVRTCAAYVERIRAAGARVELKTYAGAHHGFDTAGVTPVWLARAQNFRDCMVYIEDDGRTTLEGTGEAVPTDDPRAAIAILRRSCMRTGATVGSHEEARGLALQDVKTFIQTHLSK